MWKAIYSPCGKYIISGSDDKNIKIWEVESGECLRTLYGHTGWMGSLDISTDG